jgi:hypothetical protein
MVMTLSETMANSFENSFKGIIKGTMSVSDAFRNMLNRVADHFLDTAARMMANQLQQGLLGMLGSIFNPFDMSAMNMRDYRMYGNTFPAGSFANGGYAQRNKSYIVGERGPELFTPGASGGQVSPMGSTSIVINVDASGSAVEGDEEEGRQLGQLMASAIQSELIKQKRPGGLLA